MTAPNNQVNVQGQGVVSADVFNTYVQNVTNFAAAAAFPGTTGMVIYILGFTTNGDGGQGHFAWNASATGPSDGSTIIVPTGNAIGAWVRIGAVTNYSYQVPLTGFTILIPVNAAQLILNPAGTLSTGTVTLPANPIDGQTVGVSSSHIISTLTVNASAGGSVVGAPTTIATANTGFKMQYVASVSTWFRIL